MQTHLQGASAVIICYDASSVKSFENISEWAAKTRAINPDVPIVLLSTKCDKTKEDEKKAKQEQLAAKAEEIDASLYFEVSAKDDINVKAVFITLTKKLNDEKMKEQKEKDVALAELKEKQDKIASQITAISEAIHAAQTSAIKKDNFCSSARELSEIEEHADAPHRRTTKAKELNKIYFDWNNFTSALYKEHRKKLIIEGCKFAQSKSGLFKKPARDLSSLNLDSIEAIPEKKPDSRTAKFVSALPRPAI